MEKSSIIDNALAMIREDVSVRYNELTIDQHILTSGVVKKVYEIYRVLKEKEGAREIYLLPLRRSDEPFTRDVFLPEHYIASFGGVDVRPEAFQEFNNNNPQNLVVDGWMHFHPGFSPNPSPKDTKNNLAVLLQLPHNRITGLQETLMKNMRYALKGEKVLLSDLLTGEQYGMPISQIKEMLTAFTKFQSKGRKISDEEIAEFLDWYFGEQGPGFKIMSRYRQAELQYARSTIFSGQGLEQVLKLDGTPNGGRIRFVYSEAIVQEYIGGKPVGDPRTIKNIPIKVISIEDDIKVDTKEIEYLVNQKIILPRRPKPPVEKPEVPEEKPLEKVVEEAVVPVKEERIIVERRPSVFKPFFDRLDELLKDFSDRMWGIKKEEEPEAEITKEPPKTEQKERHEEGEEEND